MDNKKVLVAYFSASGVTKNLAGKLAKAVNADLHEIRPKQEYKVGDLDWNNTRSRALKEVNDLSARPEISNKVENIDDYDVVFLGYPIWKTTAPKIVNCFIENENLKGKTVIPFATSNSSKIRNSVRGLSKSYKDLKLKEGCRLNPNTEMKALKNWAENIIKK